MGQTHQKLDIIFANGRPPPPFNLGGDGVSMDTFLCELACLGFNCLAIGVLDHPKLTLQRKQVSSTYTYTRRAIYSKELLTTLSQKLNSSGFPIIFTQLEMCQEIVPYALERKVPTVLFIHDAEPENLWVLDKIKTPSRRIHIVFNSQFTKNKYRRWANSVPNSIIHPPIRSSDYIGLGEDYEKKFVTMINPVKPKGGETFYEIARSMTEISFLAVENWYHPRNDGINIHQLPNVTYLSKQTDMRKIYGQTQLLLVPSIWEEGFGRVAAEALTAGVTVVASNRGGLPEAVGDGGILIDDFKNPREWVDVISEVLTNGRLLREFTRKGKIHSERFDSKLATRKLVDVIRSF